MHGEDIVQHEAKPVENPLASDGRTGSSPVGRTFLNFG